MSKSLCGTSTTKPRLSILIDARALVEKPGRWIQGRYVRIENGEPCYCVMGAIKAASGFMWDDAEDNRRAYGAFAVHNGITRNLHHWNDEPGRTQEQVIAAFDRAIEGERNAAR